eukprot:6398658-Pyramimonas_sp.AAC.2
MRTTHRLIHFSVCAYYWRGYHRTGVERLRVPRVQRRLHHRRPSTRPHPQHPVPPALAAALLAMNRP